VVQELTLAESLEEYVKAAMLVEMLVASGELPLVPGFERTLFDMSVGYDLAGISGARVTAFLDGLRDATPAVERLRGEIPPEHRTLRDLPFATALSSTLTLSTFHGCPPDEIERIVRHLQERHRLHCIVKLNPVLLGPEETHRLLHDALGYHEIHVPEGAFARDASWTQMTDFVGRLGESAAAAGLGFGVKFSKHPDRREPPLLLPGQRARDVPVGPAAPRARDGARRPLPARVRRPLSHLLRGRDRARQLRRDGGARAGAGHRLHRPAQARRLRPRPRLPDRPRREDARGRRAHDRRVGDPRLRARPRRARARGRRSGRGLARALPERARHGRRPRSRAGTPLFARWVSEARLLNSADHAARAAADPRYAAGAHRALPRKIGRHLELFDCINCEKCVPVCPNDANFFFALEPCRVEIVHVRRAGGRWLARDGGAFEIRETRQIGNFADFCNDCGNCDVFCPEDGGPYLIKPRFFASAAAWEADRPRDGFHLERRGDGFVAHARFAGRDYRLELEGGHVRYLGDGFRLDFEESDPLATLTGESAGEVDLTYARLMALVGRALLAPSAVNYASCL